MATEKQVQQARVTAETLQQHPLVAGICRILATDLRPDLYYHSVHHTLDVLSEAVLFASLDRRSERELELIALAAAYHDAGFLQQDFDNEEIAADMLVECMRDYGGYRDEEIECTRQMILDTQLVEDEQGLSYRPRGQLSKYLLDADMSNLGRDDFFSRMESLIQERQADRMTVMLRALKLMQSHTWFTSVAHELREKKKIENLQRLKQMIAAAPD